jgi:hypothetical protein
VEQQQQPPQRGTPILEEICASSPLTTTSSAGSVGSAGGSSPSASVDGGAESDAGGEQPGEAAVAVAAMHAGLVLGGPYTSDTQVVFCPALRWHQQQQLLLQHPGGGGAAAAAGPEPEPEPEPALEVSWLRRHRPGPEGGADGGGTACSIEWIPIAGAHGWSYTPCATDVDCELQATVRTTASASGSSNTGSSSGSGSGSGSGFGSSGESVGGSGGGGMSTADELVQSAQQARLKRLTGGGGGSGSGGGGGAGSGGSAGGSSQLLCVALSPPLRLDPLTVTQVESWIGTDGRGDVSFAVAQATCSSRLMIHGKDGMLTLHIGPRPMPDERPVWYVPLTSPPTLTSLAVSYT